MSNQPIFAVIEEEVQPDEVLKGDLIISWRVNNTVSPSPVRDPSRVVKVDKHTISEVSPGTWAKTGLFGIKRTVIEIPSDQLQEGDRVQAFRQNNGSWFKAHSDSRNPISHYGKEAGRKVFYIDGGPGTAYWSVEEHMAYRIVRPGITDVADIVRTPVPAPTPLSPHEPFNGYKAASDMGKEMSTNLPKVRENHENSLRWRVHESTKRDREIEKNRVLVDLEFEPWE